MARTRSNNYVASLGYWGTIAFVSNTIVTPPPPITDMVTFDCPFNRLSMNDGALYTHLPQVTLNTCGPNPSEMMFSNDGGFANAVWQPYTHTVPWSTPTHPWDVAASM